MANPRIKSSNPPGVAGPLLFVSGQVALDEEGRPVCVGDPAGQAKHTFAAIQKLLRAEGAEMSEVVKVTVYVTDIRFLDPIKAARLEYWPEGGPASAIVEVSNLTFPELLVEIEAVAVAP